MKIRPSIIKRQGGGAMYDPFMPYYQDYNDSLQSANPNDVDTGGKIGDLQKEIFKIISPDSLPSDMAQFWRETLPMLQRAERYGQWDMATYAQVSNAITKVKFNNDQYKKASEYLTENGNWNEVAVTGAGKMYVIDNETGKLETVSPFDYYEQKDKYSTLSNNDIMTLRSRDIPFNIGIINDVSGSVSISAIQEYVRNTVENLGISRAVGITNSDVIQMTEAWKDLYQGGTPGYYKFVKESQIPDSGAAMLVNYLVNALPTNMKQQLLAKTAAEGKNPSTDSTNLLLQILAHHTDQKQEIEFDSTATKSAGVGTDASSNKLVNDTYAYRVAAGTSGLPQKVFLVPGGAKIGDHGMYVAEGIAVGPIVDRQRDQVTAPISLSYFMGKAEATKGANQSSVTFGNQLLTPDQYNRILINNTEQLATVELPYTMEGGKIKPDFDKIPKFNEWKRKVKEHPNATEMEMRQWAQSLQLGDLAFDPKTKSFKIKDTYRFLVVSGYAEEDALGMDKENRNYVEHVDPDQAKRIKDSYKNLVKYGEISPSKNDPKIGKWSKWNAFKNDVYRGNIFIPIDNAVQALHVTTDQYVPQQYMEDFTATYTVDQILQAGKRQEPDKPLGQFK